MIIFILTSGKIYTRISLENEYDENKEWRKIKRYGYTFISTGEDSQYYTLGNIFFFEMEIGGIFKLWHVYQETARISLIFNTMERRKKEKNVGYTENKVTLSSWLIIHEK